MTYPAPKTALDRGLLTTYIQDRLICSPRGGESGKSAAFLIYLKVLSSVFVSLLAALSSPRRSTSSNDDDLDDGVIPLSAKTKPARAGADTTTPLWSAMAATAKPNQNNKKQPPQ
jgi:hypothetical protein